MYTSNMDDNDRHICGALIDDHTVSGVGTFNGDLVSVGPIL